MTWVAVGIGAAVGATAGAIAGSQKGGDDVWKGALMGGALGAAGGAPFGGAAAAEAALPAVAPEAVGMLGGEALAPAAAESLAFTGPSVGSVVAPAAETGIASVAPAAAPATTGGMGTLANLTPAQTAEITAQANANTAAGLGPWTSPEPIQMVTPPAQPGSLSANKGLFSVPEVTGTTTPSVAPEVTGNATWNLGNAGQAEAQPGSYLSNKEASKSMFDKAIGWVEENPFKAGILGFTALGLSGALNRDNNQTFGQSSVTPAGYPLSPNFRPSRYEPARSYAGGGVASIGSQGGMFPQSQYDKTQFSTPSQMPVSREVVGSDYDSVINPYTGDLPRFAKGGRASSAEQFAAMTQAAAPAQETPPAWLRRELVDPESAGTFVDTDVETRDQPAQTAAQTRMSNLAKKYGIVARKQTPEEQASTKMAGGGIADLGGYAHGGNPRLLRGPGDGMSDDIPATIAGKQPARLADGEFVVPADVVSGLGNGSTEAGAKKLHQMMDKVRVDRTGTKKQGKQIKAEKYVPKMAEGGIAEVKHYASGNLVIQDNQVGTIDDSGSFVPLDASALTQTKPVAPAASSSVGYDPNYYNPKYYQSQIDAANKDIEAQRAALSNIQQTPAFDAKYYLSQYPQIAQSEKYGNNLYQHYLDWGKAEARKPYEGAVGFDPEYYLKNNPDVASSVWATNPAHHYALWGRYEGRSPYEGAKAGVLGADVQDAAAVDKINQQIAATQASMAPAQQNLERLAASPIKYSDYTIANRPSAAEPQFYGNIYQEHYFDYAKPGYDMNANLGVWNNEYGGSREPTARQNRIAQMSYDQQAAAQQSLENAQAAALKSRQVINQAVNTGKNQPPAEEKKVRKGGILAAGK